MRCALGVQTIVGMICVIMMLQKVCHNDYRMNSLHLLHGPAY